MGWMDEIKAEFVKTFIRDDRYKVFLTGFENTILITLVSIRADQKEKAGYAGKKNRLRAVLYH